MRAEIRDLRNYFKRQMRWYRGLGTGVIVTAGLVPFLATVPAIPRVALGALGAAAVILQGLQGLYQFRDTAQNARMTANALERVLNRYMTSADPYTGSVNQAFPRFRDDIEAIRESADLAFSQIWQQATASPPQAMRDGTTSKPGILPKAEGH